MTVQTKPPPITCAAVVACVLGCNDLPELRYETEHLRIGTASDGLLCQGNLDHYERLITTLEQQLGTSVRTPIHVYLWDESRFFPDSGWCDDSLIGCYRQGAVYADFISIEHELVHAVVDTFATPTPFWSEGAAMALGSSRTFFGETSPVDNLDLHASPQLDYRPAGHFSRWLLETHGLELYRELLRARGSSREAFERTYDMTMEEAQELYFAEAPHAYGALNTCDHPDLPQTGDLQWSETIEIDCAAPNVWGTSQVIGALRVLTVTERGFYELTTTEQEGAIIPCFDEDLEHPVLVGDPNYGDVPPASGGFLQVFTGDRGKSVLELVPGRYELSIAHEGHETRTAALTVRAATGPIPQTPESAG
ncbi:hypothetical protein ENSA7_28630 [Enhygromyxa salina]|uniref:Uncharacterized protein n=2 Tax=Enhygromyxa salina TaxID=215803 RepID=A0A2S9YQW2_9BACT|nr:hypothetical protein ENSA7_28630 [Enhygromyxa salina]